MSERQPPCDCIEKVNGRWTYRCECSNGGDAEGAATWVADENNRAEITALRAEAALRRDNEAEMLGRNEALTCEVVDLRAEVERLEHRRRWNVEERGNGRIGVCRQLHEKHEACDYEEYVPAADLSTANLKIERLTEVLKWIAQQRYTKRDTIHPGNAFEKAGELNQKLILIMDHAANAIRDVPAEEPTTEG